MPGRAFEEKAREKAICRERESQEFLMDGHSLKLIYCVVCSAQLSFLGGKMSLKAQKIGNGTDKQDETVVLSTTLNFGVLPLVEIDHVTRWCPFSAGAYLRLVPVFGNFAQNIALYNKNNRVLLSQALCVIVSLGKLIFHGSRVNICCEHHLGQPITR